LVRHFGRRFRDRLDLPSAFELAGRRHRKPSTHKHVPSHPPRSDGARAVGPRNVGMHRRGRRPMSAAAVRECCEFCEHRSPRFRWAAEAVSAKESDRLVVIAHPNAARRRRGWYLAVSRAWSTSPSLFHQRGYCPFGRCSVFAQGVAVF
jgi:hypothetical protein